jgi:hypothetical protein
VAYRSWLKDVKRLDDLATFLHFFPSNHREWDRENALEDKMYEQINNAPIPVNSNIEIYFQGGLHDGYVFGVERVKDTISISIANFYLDQFVTLYDTETDVDREVDYSPVRLVFEGVNYANAVRPDPEGWLKWDDWETWDSECDRFVRCWFHQQGGKVQWVGHFHKNGKGRTKQNSSLFILIDCERVTAKPETERALRKRLGDECYYALMFVQALPQNEQWLYLGHLKQYLDEKGIPRRVIPHQSERE